MRKRILVLLLAAVIGAAMITGCGKSAETTGEATTKEETTETANDTAANDTAEAADTAANEQAAATTNSTNDTGVADITARMVGTWQDDASNTYAFSDDYTYEGYDPETDTTRNGVFSLVTDGTHIVLSIKAETNTDISQYYVTAADDYSSLVLTDVNSGDEYTLTPVQQ